MDRSWPLEEEDHQVLQETTSSRRVVAMNKMDQPSRWAREVLSLGGDVAAVGISAMTGEGLDALRGALRTVLVGGGDVGWVMRVGEWCERVACNTELSPEH
mgnify:CR=1 FL=1